MSELSSSLLQVITHSGVQASKKGSVPLFMDFPVNPHLAPFLVTRAKSGEEMSLWVNRVKNGRIKAALRHVPSLDDFYRHVVLQVIGKGREEAWGNVHALDKAGVEAAVAHLKEYGFEEIEILAHPQTPWQTIDPSWEVEPDGMVLSLLGIPVQPTKWLPKDTVVVVPTDREMVGFVFLTQERIASVVHNAARGMGIATSRVSQ